MAISLGTPCIILIVVSDWKNMIRGNFKYFAIAITYIYKKMPADNALMEDKFKQAKAQNWIQCNHNSDKPIEIFVSPRCEINKNECRKWSKALKKQLEMRLTPNPRNDNFLMNISELDLLFPWSILYTIRFYVVINITTGHYFTKLIEFLDTQNQQQL